VVSSYPEVISVLAAAGLHCIGCHVSTYESIEEGCSAHGLNKKEIDALVLAVNNKIKEQESLPEVKFSPLAVEKLLERKKSKPFVRLVGSFGGFDFESADSKMEDEIEIEVKASKKPLTLIVSKKIERILRGLVIDFDKKEKDFSAKKAE
jgi:hybrid cluster-associated redox disulfide protein